MIQLNFPNYDFDIIEREHSPYIKDIIRKKYIALTPEEWVRQHLINTLINIYNYPKGLFRIEKKLTYDKLTKRADLLILDKKGNPFLVCECKSYKNKLDFNTVKQVAEYNSRLNCKYFLITNGIETFCFQKNLDTNSYIQIDSIPSY